MAAKGKKPVQNVSPKQEDNAFVRILHLPVVSSACISLQKTYATTKEAHPLMASVCQAYEKGIRSASSLAVWSVKPVVQKLEPQFAAANSLACRGLDHLEQRIPALHKPVETVTSDLKDSISTHYQNIMRSVSDTLDRILSIDAESYERSENSLRDTTEYARSSRASSNLEKLVDFLLPKAEMPPGGSESKETSHTSIFGKIRALAGIISQHAYKQTVQAIQHTRDKGQELVMWLPGLGGLARQSTMKAHHVLSDVQNAATGWLSQQPGKVVEATQKEDQRSEGIERAKRQSQGGGLAQNLETASLSTISGLKNAPLVAWKLVGQLLPVSPHKAVSEAGAKVAGLRRTLHNVTSGLQETISHYVPLPRILVKETEMTSETADCAELRQQEEGAQPGAAHTQERGAPSLRGDRRFSRGHYPLPFLNLDEPLLPQPTSLQRHWSPAFEAEYAGARKSAFSPYKEVVSTRRWSEGVYRSGPEPAYTRAHYTGLHGTTLKKD